MNHDSKSFHCDPCHGNCTECTQASRARISGAYRKGLRDVVLLVFAGLACASVVGLFGVAP